MCKDDRGIRTHVGIRFRKKSNIDCRFPALIQANGNGGVKSRCSKNTLTKSYNLLRPELLGIER